MRRSLLLTAGVGAAALAAVVAWPRASHPRHARAHPLPDERPRSPGIHRATGAELAAIDRASRVEAAKLAARRAARDPAKPSVPSTTWVNLGPSDAPQEFNWFSIASVDSGRPNALVVDPRDPDVVYVAVSGGGVWKTFDLRASAGASWAPTMDAQPNLAVGALALDPDHPDTVYAGTGDAFDTAGNTVLTSTDGGGTWGEPIVLSGTNAAGFVAQPSAIRQLAVQDGRVLAATDVGLFESTDGGQTFALVDLPNADGLVLAEAMWSVVPVGGTAWVASGVTACGPGWAPWTVYGGFDPDPGNCPAGNNTAIWRSDDGATWSLVTTPARVGTGRTTLAAGGTADPARTVVYAFVGAVGGDRTRGFWRSDDAGATWVDATGTLANPTLVDQNFDDSCASLDVGHNQTWYNEAIVVDPTDPDHVLVGGNLCGMRTLNGTSASPTWELVSHWLPGPGYGETARGRLPYVHADWHAAAAVAWQGRVTALAGTDGGVFVSDDVFAEDTPAEAVTWTHRNKGLATHLMYSIASGDPAAGDPFVTFGGLQDNGTRFRADPANPSGFNQPVGGDGIGATVHHSSSGTTYYASVQYARVFCRPAEVDCSVEVVTPPDDASAHWHTLGSPIGAEAEEEAIAARTRARAARSGEDQEPFFEHYADVETDTTGQSVLTHTDEQVFVTTPDGDGLALTPISQDLTDDPRGGGFTNVTASRGTPGLYGAAGAVSSAPFYVTTAGNTMATWTAASAVHPTGTAVRLAGASSIDFPPVLPDGTEPGQVFVGAFTGPMTDYTPPPDAAGRLWRTTDFGATWTSIVGADPDHRLPNVPIYVVKYDPVEPTTIYAGTQLGVYLTRDDGQTWDRMGDDFPMVPVRDLYVAKNQDFIRAATYGRGVWEIYPSATAAHGAPGNGDFDRNLRLDWVDLGAMSARLGRTPATRGTPRYSWIVDLSGDGADPPVQAIDDADLRALLAAFGGHP